MLAPELRFHQRETCAHIPPDGVVQPISPSYQVAKTIRRSITLV